MFPTPKEWDPEMPTATAGKAGLYEDVVFMKRG